VFASDVVRIWNESRKFFVDVCVGLGSVRSKRSDHDEETGSLKTGSRAVSALSIEINIPLPCKRDSEASGRFAWSKI